MTTEERLSEYLEYFSTAKFPPVPFRINKYMSVTGVDGFIQSQVSSIRSPRNTDAGREVNLQHLEDLKRVCEGM